MAFLADKDIFSNEAKYDDWKAHLYGPYSDDLTSDIDHYVDTGSIKITTVVHPLSGEPANSYSLTELGDSKFNSIYNNNNEIKKIQNLLLQYQFHDTNARLLRHIYKNHKKYTDNSAITGQYA